MKRTYITSAGLTEQQAEKTLRELKLGYLNLSDGFFPQAELNFKLALEFDPTCADAFWGLMLVKSKLTNEDELYSNPMQFKDVVTFSEYEKAMEYADADLKKKYQNLLERIYKINEGDNY